MRVLRFGDHAVYLLNRSELTERNLVPLPRKDYLDYIRVPVTKLNYNTAARLLASYIQYNIPPSRHIELMHALGVNHYGPYRPSNSKGQYVNFNGHRIYVEPKSNLTEKKLQNYSRMNGHEMGPIFVRYLRASPANRIKLAGLGGVNTFKRVLGVTNFKNLGGAATKIQRRYRTHRAREAFKKHWLVPGGGYHRFITGNLGASGPNIKNIPVPTVPQLLRHYKNLGINPRWWHKYFMR